MNYKRAHFVHLGPQSPMVPFGDFNKVRLSDEQLREAWTIVGPTVEKNANLPLWELLTVVYLDGLQIGYGIAEKRVSPNDPT
jgi:hypothetical protein